MIERLTESRDAQKREMQQIIINKDLEIVALKNPVTSDDPATATKAPEGDLASQLEISALPELLAAKESEITSLKDALEDLRKRLAARETEVTFMEGLLYLVLVLVLLFGFRI